MGWKVNIEYIGLWLFLWMVLWAVIVSMTPLAFAMIMSGIYVSKLYEKEEERHENRRR